MAIKLQQQETKLDKKQWQKHLKALQENIVYLEINKRIVELREESKQNWLCMHQTEPGRKWHERMFAFDEVLGIPDDILAESLEAERQERLR